MTKPKTSLEAERLWHNCIHKNIGSFTMSQEKQAIKDIELFLIKYKTKALADQKVKMMRIIDEIKSKQFNNNREIFYSKEVDDFVRLLKEEFDELYTVVDKKFD